MLPQLPALGENWRDALAAHERAIVFCWAEWSTPDWMFAPILSSVMPDFADQFAFFKADLDAEDLVPFFVEMGVTTNPQLLLLDQGMRVTTSIGCMQPDQLRVLLRSWQDSF